MNKQKASSSTSVKNKFSLVLVIMNKNSSVAACSKEDIAWLENYKASSEFNASLLIDKK